MNIVGSADISGPLTARYGKGINSSVDDGAMVAHGFHMTQDPISSKNATPAMGSNALLGVSMREGVRRLTPTECERLQGFPDGWTLMPEQLDAGEPNPAPDSHRYSQMGNAVTVNVAHWIGRRIMVSTRTPAEAAIAAGAINKSPNPDPKEEK